MELGLKGRTAVIAGASTGSATPLPEVWQPRGSAGEITRESDVEVLTIPTNMKDTYLVNAAAAVVDRFGTIHILVYTAGNRMRRPDRQILWED
jgi:hypothetical protein